LIEELLPQPVAFAGDRNWEQAAGSVKREWRSSLSTKPRVDRDFTRLTGHILHRNPPKLLPKC